MQVTVNASVSEATLLPSDYYGCPMAMFAAIRVTDACTLGTLTAVIRWEDRLLGSMVKNIVIPITVLKSFVVVNDLWIDLAENTVATIEFVAVSVVGSFEVDFNLNQYQPSGF